MSRNPAASSSTATTTRAFNLLLLSMIRNLVMLQIIYSTVAGALTFEPVQSDQVLGGGNSDSSNECARSGVFFHLNPRTAHLVKLHGGFVPAQCEFYDGVVETNAGLGNCLFLSLASAAGFGRSEEDGALMRRELTNYITTNFNANIGITTYTFCDSIRDTLVSCEMTAGYYQGLMSTNGMWGGLTEIAAFSELCGRRVLVYRTNGDRLELVWGIGSEAMPPVRLRYTGAHYERIKDRKAAHEGW
jgi:hypothetical protein